MGNNFKDSLIDKLEAASFNPTYDDRMGNWVPLLEVKKIVEEHFANLRQSVISVEDKIIAASKATPIPVPTDKEGYSKWLKGSDDSLSNFVKECHVNKPLQDALDHTDKLFSSEICVKKGFDDAFITLCKAMGVNPETSPIMYEALAQAINVYDAKREPVFTGEISVVEFIKVKCREHDWPVNSDDVIDFAEEWERQHKPVSVDDVQLWKNHHAIYDTKISHYEFLTILKKTGITCKS